MKTKNEHEDGQLELTIAASSSSLPSIKNRNSKMSSWWFSRMRHLYCPHFFAFQPLSYLFVSIFLSQGLSQRSSRLCGSPPFFAICDLHLPFAIPRALAAQTIVHKLLQ